MSRVTDKEEFLRDFRRETNECCRALTTHLPGDDENVGQYRSSLPVVREVLGRLTELSRALRYAEEGRLLSSEEYDVLSASLNTLVGEVSHFAQGLQTLSNCISFMKEGSVLKKVTPTSLSCGDRGVLEKRVFLSEDHCEIRVFSTFLSRCGCVFSVPDAVRVDGIKEVRRGKNTKTFWMQSSLASFQEDCCFSVIFGDDYESLDLVASSPDEVNSWVTGLSSLMSERVSDCIPFMKEGSVLKKVTPTPFISLSCGDGGVLEKRVFLSEDHCEIKVSSKSLSTSGCVRVDDIKEVRRGKNTKTFWMHSSLASIPEDCCFSVIFGDDYESLDLVASSPDEANSWVAGLSSLMRERVFSVPDAVRVDDINEVRRGKNTKDCCFSVIFGDDYESLDLVASSPDEANSWVAGLSSLMSERVSDCISFMKEGSVLKKVTPTPYMSSSWGAGGVLEKWVFLSEDHCEIKVSSKSLSTYGCVCVDDIKEVRGGKNTKTFKMHSSLASFPEDCCFSVIFGDNYESLDLVASSPSEANSWVTGLSSLMSERDVKLGGCVPRPTGPLAMEQEVQGDKPMLLDRHGQSTAERLENGRNRERMVNNGSNQQLKKGKQIIQTRLSWSQYLYVLLMCLPMFLSGVGKQIIQMRLSWSKYLSVVLFMCLPMFSSSVGTIICPENLTATLGGQGHISCNFPDDFDEVHWFDNVSDSSYAVITLKPNEGTKYGQGFESGAYDVHQNGSLIITNVTKWQEREYKVIIYRKSSLSPSTFFISLKVIASPGDQFPMVECNNCHQEYYYSVMNNETRSCSFGAARPPVQLEWFEQLGGGYDLVEMQQFNITENSNGTYNSLATLHTMKDSINLIHSLVCRATWPLSDWRREKEILVDFSSNISFSDVTPKVQYMEINKHGIIQCGQSASVYVIWKRIFSNSEPDIIGLYSHVMTETISNTPDVEVSAEGSLVFSSPQVHHEGVYACIYGDGQKEEIEITSIELLIPPSPPYIQITGCDDVSDSCVFKEDSTKKLTCAVYGVRPTATLEWIAEEEDKVSFPSENVVIKERGDTSDIILSVEYKVSPDVLCGEEIIIRCHLYGPLSKIMKAEATALVIQASCMESEVKGENRLVVVVVAVVLGFILVFTFLAILILLIYRYRTLLKKKSMALIQWCCS